MNKEIEKMLKYQEVDMKLYLLDKKLKNADETKKWMDATSRKKEFKDEYVNVDRDINNEMASINKATEDFNSLMAEANDLENSITENSTIEQIDFFLKKIDDILKKIKDVEIIASESKRNLEKLTETADKDLRQIVKYTQQISEFKPIVEELTKKTKAEAKKIMVLLNDVTAKQGIDTNSKLFKAYTAKKKHKMPVFVELNGNNCGGCGVDVATYVVDTAKKQGYAECPNCGRIMYYNGDNK